MDRWPFWVGALALGAVAVATLAATGRPLGVSGFVAAALGRPGAPPRAGSLLFLVGIVSGGLVAALSDAGLTPTLVDAAHARFFGAGVTGALALLAGGVLVGFGTAWAGGCTSGHGLVGVSRLQPGSLVATAAFFGTAVAVSFALSLVLGGTP
ncbi:MAG: YeeE/YedE family protein [Deltaproteobacteria bacterium]|nr:YeeE/YedE family protein [Deltaproteobacteria bacterium]